MQVKYLKNILIFILVKRVDVCVVCMCGMYLWYSICMYIAYVCMVCVCMCGVYVWSGVCVWCGMCVVCMCVVCLCGVVCYMCGVYVWSGVCSVYVVCVCVVWCVCGVYVRSGVCVLHILVLNSSSPVCRATTLLTESSPCPQVFVFTHLLLSGAQLLVSVRRSFLSNAPGSTLTGENN